MALFSHVTFVDISVNFKSDMGWSFVILSTEVNYKILFCMMREVIFLDLSVNVQSDMGSC